MLCFANGCHYPLCSVVWWICCDGEKDKRFHFHRQLWKTGAVMTKAWNLLNLPKFGLCNHGLKMRKTERCEGQTWRWWIHDQISRLKIFIFCCQSEKLRCENPVKAQSRWIGSQCEPKAFNSHFKSASYSLWLFFLVISTPNVMTLPWAFRAPSLAPKYLLFSRPQ